MLRACKYCFLQFYFWSDSINWYDILNVGQRFSVAHFGYFSVHSLLRCVLVGFFLLLFFERDEEREKKHIFFVYIHWAVRFVVDVLIASFTHSFKPTDVFDVHK